MRQALEATYLSDVSKDIRKLATLLQISKALSSTMHLKAGLDEALETLARDHGAFLSVVAIIDADLRQLKVEAAHGVTRPSERIRYTLGEGIVGRVAETGKPVVVPRISAEPAMVHRATARDSARQQEQSFICVPITVAKRTVGALGITLKYKSDRSYEQSAKFFGIVGSMIGQAVKIQRLVAAERSRLLTENAQLRQELRDRYDFSGLIGSSSPMRRVYEQVEQVARTNTTVLSAASRAPGRS